MNESIEQLYVEALKVVMDREEVDVIFLQRHLRTGYALTMHLIDRMESAGAITERDAHGRREVVCIVCGGSGEVPTQEKVYPNDPGSPTADIGTGPCPKCRSKRTDEQDEE